MIHLVSPYSRDPALFMAANCITYFCVCPYHPLEESGKAFGRPQSFVAGPPRNGVQFMVKDSKKYAATGGWGFAHFNDGKPADEAVLNTCFPCHHAIKARDLVFTRYAP